MSADKNHPLQNPASKHITATRPSGENGAAPGQAQRNATSGPPAIFLAFALVLGALFDAPASARQSTDNNTMVLEEIVVLATKRAQTLQEVPVAVSVVSGDTMAKAQVLDIKDLQSLVPSLRVSQLQTTGNTNFLIRGFGNGANNAGIEPSVGVFIDGVYRSRSASALTDLPNLERIEVLRGPQSTLFGKNASAGVINVVTARPDLDAFGGSASVTFGEYSQLIVKGDVSGPLSDSVAFSLSGSVNQRDGYFTNLADGEEYGNRDRWGIRGQLLFVPGDNLEVRVIADVDEIDEVCCGVANLVNGPTGLAIAAVGGALVPEQPFSYTGFYDFNPVNEVKNNGLSVQFDYDFAETTLTSITAYRTQSRFENSDVDFTSARLITENSNDVELDTFSQELRLASSGDGALDWMIGGYFFDESVDVNNRISFGPAFRPYGDVLAIIQSGGTPGVDPSPLAGVEALLGVPAGAFLGAGQGNVESAGMENQAFSIFGQIDWHFTDRLTLTLGANFTEDEKDARVNIVNSDVMASIDFVQVVYAQSFEAITGMPPTPALVESQPAADAAAYGIATRMCDPATPSVPCNPLLPLQAFQFLPPFVSFPNAAEPGTTNDDDVTWTARLAFDATDNINLYVGAGTGFKASSWNLSRDSLPFAATLPALGSGPGDRFGVPNLMAGFRYAGPEEASVIELGMKAQWDTFTVNAAVFDQEIKGFQSNIFNGTGFNLQNAGKQSTTGVEVDMLWLATDTLELSFSGTWLDPVYDSFPNFVFPDGSTQDLSGTQVPGVHEFSMNTSFLWNFQMGSIMGFVRGEYVYDNEVPVIENVPASIASREVSTVNASIGLAWENGFEAMLWGRNLTDDEYLLSAFPSVAQSGSFSAYPNEPRTYGVTVTMHFD